MEVRALLHESGLITFTEVASQQSAEITGLSCHSKKVTPGTLFISIPCPDSLKYCLEAIENEAAVIIADSETIQNLQKITFKTPILLVSQDSPRLALSNLARAFYNMQPTHCVAVTGTNGKTSTAHFTQQLWLLLGNNAASMGTLGLKIGKKFNLETEELPGFPSLTTADPISLHCALAQLTEKNADYLALEASSHGLDQFRLDGVQLQAAGFTNLTQDHLDYHPNLEAYFSAKARLFENILPEGATAVLNVESPYYERLHTICHTRGHRIIGFGVGQSSAQLKAENIHSFIDHTVFDICYEGDRFTDISLNVTGTFQVENLLCALGFVLATGTSLKDVIPLIPRLTAVPGRMEYVGSTSNEGSVFVDYAHTPDALEKSLQYLKRHTQGKIWVVFGCGGNRDTTKRYPMGKIAHQLADCIVVTDDNPRFEDPAAIRQQILKACPTAHEIADRHQAIHFAASHLGKSDALLIAGKGHEQGQIMEKIILPFDDIIVAREIIRAI